MAGKISGTEDVIDVRDVEARRDELRDERDAAEDGGATPDEAREALADWDTENGDELATLEALLDDLRGNGGDHQIDGDWYPATLIKDSYFAAYAREYAEDCGMIESDVEWPGNCVDWEKAAAQLQQDYTTTEINGVTYWYR